MLAASSADVVQARVVSGLAEYVGSITTAPKPNTGAAKSTAAIQTRQTRYGRKLSPSSLTALVENAKARKASLTSS